MKAQFSDTEECGRANEDYDKTVIRQFKDSNKMVIR